jgi:hypothetical protein
VVHFLYDARYAEAGWMVEVLAWSLLAMRYRVTTYAILATGDSRTQFRQSFAATAAVAICAGAGLQFAGLPGFLLGLAVAPMLASLVTLFRAIQLGLIDWLEEVRWLPLIGIGYGLGLIAGYLIDLLPRWH